MTLNIIVDTSGSMADMAKSKIERIVLDNLVFYSRYCQKDLEFRVFFWNDAIREASVITEKIMPEGRILFEPLVDFFTQKQVPSPDRKKEMWLFLSDGNWKLCKLEEFIELRKGMFPDVCVLAIGSDADMFKLEKFAGFGKVFRAEDIYAALESCMQLNQQEACDVE